MCAESTNQNQLIDALRQADRRHMCTESTNQDQLIDALRQEISRLKAAAKEGNEPAPAEEASAISTSPYDDAFRTETNDAPHLVIPMVNEIFGEHFTGRAKVRFSPNEHYLMQPDGAAKKRITDASFTVEEGTFQGFLELAGEDGNHRHYLWECEAKATNSRMLFRVFEYVTQVGLDQESRLEGNRLLVKIPRSAILFLRSNANTPDCMELVFETEQGTLGTKVHVVRMADYDVDTIFEKKLFLLLPFYLFRFERQFAEIEADGERVRELTGIFQDISRRLEALVPEEGGEAGADPYGLVDARTRQILVEMTKKVARSLAAGFPNIQKGVLDVMGGQILDYEAKRIWNDGISIGRRAGKQEGIGIGRQEGIGIGRQEGRILESVNIFRNDMGWDNARILDAITQRFGLTKDAARRYVFGS